MPPWRRRCWLTKRSRICPQLSDDPFIRESSTVGYLPDVMRAAVSVLVLLSLLSACAASSKGQTKLANSSWHFISIDGAAPVSDKAKLRFEKDRIGATVGCNGMGGPWRVESGRLIAGPLAQTQMYCEGEIWSQEKAIGALLAGAPEVQVKTDRLVLKSSGHSAELARAE